MKEKESRAAYRTCHPDDAKKRFLVLAGGASGMARRSRSPTVKDIARRAGVSVSTVSRVINGHRSVREDLRDRVVAAMREIGYYPNHVARSLVKQRSHILGVVIPDITNPFFPALVRAVDDSARAAGYHIILLNTDYDLRRQREEVLVLQGLQVDGILLVPATVQPDQDWLRQLRVPVVIMTRTAQAFDSVETDHVKGGLLVARHFVDLGHTVIGCVGNPEDPKWHGFRDVLAAQRLRTDYYEVTPTAASDETQIHHAYLAGKRLLQRTPRPTAIFAQNDLLALGVMRAAEELGLRIPDDVAVAGFDNTVLATALRPPLTSVAQPIYEIGRLATELLIQRIEGKLSGDPKHVLLEPRLVVRGSTLHIAEAAPLAPSGVGGLPAGLTLEEGGAVRDRSS